MRLVRQSRNLNSLDLRDHAAGCDEQSHRTHSDEVIVNIVPLCWAAAVRAS